MTKPHLVLAVITGITAVAWLVYLTMMLWEHRATLREMRGQL